MVSVAAIIQDFLARESVATEPISPVIFIFLLLLHYEGSVLFRGLTKRVSPLNYIVRV